MTYLSMRPPLGVGHDIFIHCRRGAKRATANINAWSYTYIFIVDGWLIYRQTQHRQSAYAIW